MDVYGQSNGTSRRTRTGTLLPETDFESVASTNSAREALCSAGGLTAAGEAGRQSPLCGSDKPR